MNDTADINAPPRSHAYAVALSERLYAAALEAVDAAEPDQLSVGQADSLPQLYGREFAASLFMFTAFCYALAKSSAPDPELDDREFVNLAMTHAGGVPVASLGFFTIMRAQAVAAVPQ